MSFGVRTLLAMLAILLVAVGGSVIAADRFVRSGLEENFADEVELQTRLVAAALSHDTLTLQLAAHRLGALIGRRVSIIDSAGRVLGDSDFDEASLTLLDNHADRPEIAAARSIGRGRAKRVSASTGREELKVAITAWPGIVRVSAPTAQVAQVTAQAQRSVIVAGLIALALGGVLATVVGRTIVRPLDSLASAAKQVAIGGPVRYPDANVPEIRLLVRAFRAMQESLAQRLAALEHGREETATLIESMVEGVIAADQTGNVVVCNGATRRLFSYRDGEPLPDVRQLFRDTGAREIVDEVFAGRAVLGREITLDGRNVLVTARPLPQGGGVLCLHDITDLRKLEAVRRDFVANVSHELKTPLTSIAGYAETLAGDDTDGATTRRFAAVIQTNADRMRRLVDDLLDLARLESGGWTPQTRLLDLEAAAQGAWAPFAERARAAGVSFLTSLPFGLTAQVDPDAMRQILTNLFDNALRHTPRDGRIEVSGARRPSGDVALTVDDTGSGIPGEHLDRVFERFYRADPARSRDQGGTGLGLSIVRHLVEGHGGRVHLESRVGQGTAVQVTFPAARPQSARPATHS